jgi:glycerol-3-phosphate dehydrogenase
MITRAPSTAATVQHDLIIIGGGVYGAMLALESAQRGLQALLVERDDFGAHTSWNSLRIVHGGIRYLQTLDLARFRESVRERSWLLENFPDLVRPLACLMPLYGGLKRPSVLWAALRANDLLSRGRNSRVRSDRSIPAGRVLGVDETAALFPAVRRQGMQGGALWYDAVMEDSQRVIIEILHWACAAGATCLNYVEATDVLQSAGRASGIQAVDHATGERLDFRAPVVVNCAGPWSRELARTADRDVPDLFRPSLAFNVFIDRAPPFEPAVAITPPRPGARTYFLHPWKQGFLAGTFHAPWAGPLDKPTPSDECVQRFLDELTSALSDFPLRPSDVSRVHAGLLPIREDATVKLTTRPTIHDHGASGGTAGLHSVSGVKFTTSRAVAEQVLERIYPRLPHRKIPRPFPEAPLAAAPARNLLRTDPDRFFDALRRLTLREAILTPEDVLLRRTDWGYPGGSAAREDPLVDAVTAAFRANSPASTTAPGHGQIALEAIRRTEGRA